MLRLNKLEIFIDSSRILTTSKVGFPRQNLILTNRDSPASLDEDENLVSTHQQIKEETDNYVEDYSSMMEYGGRVTYDLQSMFLRERLNALEDVTTNDIFGPIHPTYKCSMEMKNG